MGSRFELRLKSHALSIVGACVFSAVGAQNVQDTAMEKKAVYGTCKKSP